MNKIILFCSAPADLPYILSIYEENKNNFAVSIFVTNVVEVYNYIGQLNLNLEKLIFIPYEKEFSYRKIIHIIKKRNELKKLFECHFSNLKGEKIFIFTHFFDWITFSFVKKLSEINNVVFVDHYDALITSEYSKYNYNINDRIILLSLWLMTNIKFGFIKILGNKKLEFPYKKYKILRIEYPEPDEKIYRVYQYEIDNIKSNTILIFESNDLKNYGVINYTSLIISLVKKLKKEGFSIYIKPHPRLGHSEKLDNLVDMILPSLIPAEFLYVRHFLCIIGIQTYALTKFAKDGEKNVYSLIDLFNFTDDNKKRYYKLYLQEHSNNKIIFIQSIDQLIDELKIISSKSP